MASSGKSSPQSCTKVINIITVYTKKKVAKKKLYYIKLYIKELFLKMQI